MHDSRLIPAYQKIFDGEVKVLSLDLFDTLLWRKVPHPIDIFLLLGRRLKKEGWLIPAVTAEGFVSLRIEAEKRAREAKEFPHNLTEAKLSEIYWQMLPIFVPLTIEQMLAGAFQGIFGGDVSLLVKMEVALEQQLISYDPAILELIFFARQRELPLLLVSDTYFEEGHIEALLGDLTSYFDHLFISCEYGVGKREGLFDYVIETLKISPDQILHIGDNKVSDVESGRAAGLSTLHYPKQDSHFEKLGEREWAYGGVNLDEREGDFGLTSLRAKMAFSPQLQAIAKEHHFFWKYGATVLGPVLFGFVHWIYERCRAMGQSQVFCLMREGKLYAELIRRLAPYYPEHRVEAKELWVSRPFIIHAAIQRAIGKELVALMKTFLGQFTVETFCHSLGLDPAQMGKWSQKRNMILEEPKLRQELIHDLLGEKKWHHQIVQSAARKREGFLKYLKNVTGDLSQMTLVDIGWAGTTQGGLQKILGESTLLHGLYLSTTEAIHEGLLEGVVREGYLFKGGHPYTGDAYKKGLFVLEQCATAETGVGPLADIDPSGNIITHPTWISRKQKKEATAVQQGIFAFFEEMGSHLKRGVIKLHQDSEALQEQLRAILLRSMTHATRLEALRFGAWRHEHGPSRHATQVIGKDDYYDTYIQDMVPGAALKEVSLNWPTAYTAKQSEYLSLATQAVWLGQLPARCFLSEDSFPLKVHLDTGKAFSDKPHETILLRSNSNRRFYAMSHYFSKRKAIRKLLLKIPLQNTLLRFHSLRISVYDRGKSMIDELIFFEQEQTGPTISCEAAQQINFNTFFSEKELKLVCHLPQSDIYQIGFKICCEKFTL